MSQKSENVRVLTLKEIISFVALVQNTEKQVLFSANMPIYFIKLPFKIKWLAGLKQFYCLQKSDSLDLQT